MTLRLRIVQGRRATWQMATELGQQWPDCPYDGAQGRAGRLTGALEGLDHGPEGEGVAHQVAAADDDSALGETWVVDQLSDQPRLAHARLALDHCHPGRAGGQLDEEAELTLATNEDG